MADIDQLSISISADSKKAEEAIASLTRGLESLNNALSALDVNKMSKFASAVQKLSNIGIGTNATSKAIKGMANELANTYGIRTKKGIQDITSALNGLYEAEKMTRKDSSPLAADMYMGSMDNLKKAIKDNYVFRNELDESTKKVLEFIDIQKKSGSKIGFKNFVGNYTPETFKEINKALGGILDPKHTGAEEGYKKLDKVATSISKLYTQQVQNGTANGLGGVVGAFKQIADAQLPNLDGAAKAIKATKSAAQDVEKSIENVGEAAQKATEPISNIGDKVSESMKEATQDTQKFSEEAQGITEKNSFDQVAEGAKKATGEIEKAITEAREFKKTVSDMESGKSVFDSDKYNQAVRGLNVATEAVKNYKEELTGTKATPTAQKNATPDKDALSNLTELGDALEKVSGRLNMVSEKFSSVFKLLTTPIRGAAKEYAEKFRGMAENVANFQKNFKVHMKKVSDFWKRTMRTFTFMIVRKAFTAIIKEVGNAVQSLAMYSNAMGTAFNTDISNMVADFQFLGRSIISVFAPLLNIIAPIIDAIVSRIATLLSYIGMLIAALGGKATFTKAKKNVSNYAESLDSASKSAKNLTMGIDELNIISEQSGGGTKPYDGWEDGWEDVDIPAGIKGIADKLKKMWDDFFGPIKTAWDRAKQYVYDGFKTMIDSLSRLGGHVWDDFITMWNQEKTIRMLEQMFRIIGDIERVIRNLANNLDTAWQKGKVGLRIFENLRDIVATLVDHLRNVTYYMIQWAEGIDFSPLLQSFEKLTGSLTKVADFIGGVFEDIMINGVLKYVEHMIEEGVPHLQNTLADVFNTFNFTSLRKNLNKIWVAFEKMFENIHKGTTDAIGNLGKMVARFTNSKIFTDFLQRLVDITKLITAERVEKVLTGLGKGILNIAESVIKFINSDAFMKFLEVIADWIDNHSVDQIAGILTSIANAILIFKFGAFAAEKLAGFFQFFTVIKALTNLTTIAKGITDLGTSLGTAGESVGAVATSGSKLVGLSGGLSGLIPIIGSVVTGFLEFKGVSNSVEDLTMILNGGEGSLGWTITELVAKVGLATGAFTLLLGFPAGVIAAGCVAAVGALNGINQAIEQMNFDQVTNAIMTHGDTTVQQVNEWYSQATSTVAEHTQKWKDIERNLTQDRKDLDEYSKTLEGLEAAFRGVGNVTVDTADKLAKKYNDMTEATNHYIDETTEALVQDLLENRKYYEEKGKNVDDMIAKLYKNAEEEKKLYNDTQKAVNEAAQAYEDAVTKYGENSTLAQKKYAEYEKAIDAHIEAIARYREETDKIDTSEAVQHITELGKSLDLSQYNNWDEAVADIKGSLSDIQTTYETELTGINTTVQQKMEFLAQQLEEGRIDEDEYRLRVGQVTQQWTEDTNTLVDSTKQALDLYNRELALNLQDVATKAEEEWNKTNPFERFFKMGTDKDAYIQSQMQTYVNQHLGETGLTGKLKEAYSVLPDNLQSTTLEAMTRLVNETSQAYLQAEYDNEDYTKEATKGSYQNVLNALPGMLDYVAPTGEIATQLSQAYDQSVGEIDYDPTGFKTVHQMGEALEQNKEAIIDPSINVANFAAVNLDTNLSDEIKAQTGFTAACEEYATQSATALNDTLIDNTVNNTEIPSQLEEYGANTSGAFNIGFQSKTEETQGIIATWFENMNTWIHDNIHLPFGSPNKKTHEYGEDMVYGFNEGIDAVRTTTGTALGTWFAFMKGEIVRQMGEVKTLFNEKLRSIFSGEGLDVESPIAGLFQTVTTAILNQINLLGTTIQGTMATFMETYILPYFSIDVWQPLFDLLHEETFIPNFERFVVWFDEEAMLPFWEEHMLPWFAAEKWDEDIFNPVKENIELHWENFITWWDKSIKEWWETHLLRPWFQKAKWDTDVFIPLKENIYKHWENFIKWWDKSIKDWWENHLIKPWFTNEKWDTDAFIPLRDNIYDHWDKFILWWDESIKDWWENRVKPYFKKELWKEQFNYVLETAKEVFNQVRDEITERINAAADAVSGACASMCQALQEVLDMIDRVMEAMANVGNIESSATVTFNTEFRATGGFVQGDLFVANEAGPELVGTIGGRTAVASNQEITGIADAVYATGNQESMLLSQLISVTKQMLDKDPVVIGDRDIARMANNGQSQLGMSIIS